LEDVIPPRRPIAACLLALVSCTAVAEPPQATPTRIVAIGDLHGDLDNAIATLKLAGLVDANNAWSGEKAVLVQTGDTTDRGPDSAKILDLLKRLSREATAAGGRVVPLLGNHEVMNLHGDWRYVDPGDVAHFGGPEARRAAFSESGVYGSWLRTLDLAQVVGDSVFAHGGITPEYASVGIDGINAQAHGSWNNPDAAVFGSDGPLWFRGYVQEEESLACPALKTALNALGVKRMVVGHTTRRDGKIQARCSGALVVIDIGIADGYGGHLGALEINGGDARALYPSGPVDVRDPS
jgi:hypothetical protein